MTISKVQIFNITLNILGVSTPLENINQRDGKTILLNNYYELARDYVLKDFDWNFASTFRKLSRCENKNPYSEYEYCYNYPNDCICARDLFEANNHVLQKFAITSLENGEKAILTNAKDAVLRYTRRVEKEIYFSCEFSTALSYYLASLTANVIAGSLQKGEIAWEKYCSVIKHAKVLNAQEGAENLYSEKTYLDSRG